MIARCRDTLRSLWSSPDGHAVWSATFGVGNSTGRRLSGRQRPRRSNSGRRDAALEIELWSRQMLKWALIFFVISIVAGVLGFTNISAGTAAISKWLFFIAVAIFLIFLLMGLLAGEVLF
jgi:uncharacterized membrane protein YtjA (UPF0391 family)